MLHLLKLLQASKNKDCGYKQLSGRVIHHMHIAKTWSTASLGPMHRFLWVALCAFLVTATCRCGPARKREALQVLFRSQSVPFLRLAADTDLRFYDEEGDQVLLNSPAYRWAQPWRCR